jgi:hypothetical protein
MPIESPIAFDSGRIGAAAIYCSDGRYGEQIDDFLHQQLLLPRYDRLAVPGGVACMAGHFAAWREEQALTEQVRFLIDAHGLTRLVFIAHQDCVYYVQRLGLRVIEREVQQRLDLGSVAKRVQRFAHQLQIEAYFARLSDGRVYFEPVDL